MKHGQISTKELADFVRERAAIEENYAKAMVKLSKMATNGTQLGTFAPLWEVFRISSDKLALCHLELMKKLHDLIKEISRYGEEQGRVHKKSKEEVAGTLEAVQLLHGVAQLLPKSKESYHSKCQEYERLRKEGTSQKEIDKAELKSRKAGEALRRAVDKYNAARADFEQRMLDSAMVGTGESPDNDLGCPEVDEDGFTVRPDTERSEVENAGSSSSDSDYEEAEPRRFLVHIKPREAPGSAQASAEQLRATVGNLILAPGMASRSLSPSPSWSCGPSHSAPASLGERGFFSAAPPALGLSRGPSPVVLGSQDALPVATAFTEYVHAYFKGRDADSCLVKVTGELTMSFPAGIVRVFGGPAAPPVLSFRLLKAGAIEQFLPNAELLYSDPSQSDPSTKDFWLNMAALTGHLQKQAEQSPAASYYNVALLKYQFSRLGAGSAPLRLCVRWDCSPGATRVSVEYGYNGGALALPVPLANVHVLLPVEEPLTNLRLQPAGSWNLEEKRLLWKLLDVPGAPGQAGCGRLSASWEPLGGPSKPSPVAAQFSSEGSTLSGVEVELAGAGYRMSLVKKRFATGIYLAGS
ncbi:PREDICTED: F-BAR domain only protein 1 [Sturnus vulgaris]|uniref:F-BAR domain only protein 1 n=1 Tax=Sturnus vulgaris TaxID=9172 RepID=UPI00071A6D8A|nr:PREDICTED: F-BAR domain only protein 1 [Sturnus vulgaris]